MRRQIIFYMTPVDVKAILQMLIPHGVIFIESDGTVMSLQDVMVLCQDCYDGRFWSKLFLTIPNAQVLYSQGIQNKSIDYLQSEVIEFSPCTRQPVMIRDFSSVNDYFRKGGFVVVHDTEEYNRQMAACMENPVYIPNPNYIENGLEYGRFWISSACSQAASSQAKELKRIFGFIRKYMKANGKPAIDRFGYIGADAYRCYLTGECVPCSGKVRIDFS